MSVFKKIFLSFWAALVLEIIISIVFYPPPHAHPSPFVTNATLTVLRTIRTRKAQKRGVSNGSVIRVSAPKNRASTMQLAKTIFLIAVRER